MMNLIEDFKVEQRWNVFKVEEFQDFFEKLHDGMKFVV
jgi:hypothetical protein